MCVSDVLAFGRDSSILANSTTMFDQPISSNFQLKPLDWHLFAICVDCLGHEGRADGTRLRKSQMAALQDWTGPKSLTVLHTYLGFPSYYPCLVPLNHIEIANPSLCSL